MSATILEAVAERDIDLLILEELTVNRDFFSWWLERAEVENRQGATITRVRHSVTHPGLGESDLLVLYSLPRSEPHAVLIENKISAPPQQPVVEVGGTPRTSTTGCQPDQALRYKRRGEAGITSGRWLSYRTCLVAPERYLAARGDAATYEARISQEAVRGWFLDRGGDSRAGFRAGLILGAIEQSRRGYTPEMDERVTEFWHRYWECAHEEFPELELAEPGSKPAGATFFEFRPYALGPRRRIYHKLDKGLVDLQLDGAADRLEKISAELSALLGSDTTVVPTGKSSSISIRVDPIGPFADFGEQVSQARQGMRAAYRLLYLARAISTP